MVTKNNIKKIPFFRKMMRLYRRLQGISATPSFISSEKYWERRYAEKGNSGKGSYGRLARFKAEIINDFVEGHGITSVIEFGCGDGNQLKLACYPNYLGFDVSETAIRICEELFKNDDSKSFQLTNEYNNDKAILVLSLDVIYHLVEDQVFEIYINRLFNSSERYVIIYSSNTDDNPGCIQHVKHRHFTKWIEEHLNKWRLMAHIPNKYSLKYDPNNESFADFYIYEKY